MKSVGLPIGDVVSYDENTDPNGLLGRPGQYVEKTDFSDTELDTPSTDNGTVEVFANSNDAKAHKEYVDKISESAPTLGYYTYRANEYLLRLTFDIPPNRAKDYEDAFREAVKAG